MHLVLRLDSVFRSICFKSVSYFCTMNLPYSGLAFKK